MKCGIIDYNKVSYGGRWLKKEETELDIDFTENEKKMKLVFERNNFEKCAVFLQRDNKVFDISANVFAPTWEKVEVIIHKREVKKV